MSSNHSSYSKPSSEIRKRTEAKKQAYKELAKKLSGRWINKEMWEELFQRQLNSHHYFSEVHILSPDIVVWHALETDSKDAFPHSYHRVYAWYKGKIQLNEIIHLRPQRYRMNPHLDLGVKCITNVILEDKQEHMVITYTVERSSPTIKSYELKFCFLK